MSDPMTARQAWEIVRGGNPMHRRYPEEWEVMCYARACAIVEALVHAHEGLDEASEYDVPIRTAKVRALERGDEIPRVTTRKERGA